MKHDIVSTWFDPSTKCSSYFCYVIIHHIELGFIDRMICWSVLSCGLKLYWTSIETNSFLGLRPDFLVRPMRSEKFIVIKLVFKKKR